jgi:hypothetical protein
VANGSFECERCSARLSFGASECAGCGTRYRYSSGQPLAEGEAEPEEAEPKAPPSPFRYPPAAEQAHRGFAPSSALAFSVMLALGAVASINLFALIFSFLPMERILYLVSSFVTPPEVSILLEILLGAGSVVLFLGAGVLFLVWLHGANRSARSLGASGLHYTPLSSVIWWFVPVANLVVPYRVTAELWKVSHAAVIEEWQSLDTSAIMPFWWVIWLVSIATERMSASSESSGLPNSSVGVAAALTSAAGALVAAWIVFSIQRGLADKASIRNPVRR